jgi:hypothetical protein
MKIFDLEDLTRGIYLVAEHLGTVVGHAFLEPLSRAATSPVVRLTIAVHEGLRGQGLPADTQVLIVTQSRPAMLGAGRDRRSASRSRASSSSRRLLAERSLCCYFASEQGGVA